jgi:para-nitrobenzyl esterase
MSGPRLSHSLVFPISLLLTLFLSTCSSGGNNGASGAPVFQVSVTDSGNGTLQEGQQSATYSVRITNTGNASSVGNVVVNMAIPGGEGLATTSPVSISTPDPTVWGCASGSGGAGCAPLNSTIGSSLVLNVNASWTFVATVNVAANAPSPQAFMVSVAGGGAAGPGTGQDPTTIIAGAGAVQATVVPEVTFVQGDQAARYTINVTNTSPVTSVGQITMVDPPSGFTITDMNGGSSFTCNFPSTTTCSTAGTFQLPAAQTASVVVTGKVTAAAGTPVSIPLTLQIGSGAAVAVTPTPTVNVFPLLQISTLSLPNGTVGVPYSQAIQVTGGEAPYTWTPFSLSSGEPLPAGLSLGSSTGILSGTPTTAEANVQFKVRVGDASGQVAYENYTVSINAAMVQTSSGPVYGNLVACGLRECAASNVLEFLGIPYAAPPVGSLRWKPPQPTTPAQPQQPGARCMSANGKGVVMGQEDCLYLNVFQSSPVPSGQLQPVMVFIHGGANRTGTSNPGLDFSDPPELATQGVILVTVEYRLGILGFFTNPSLDLENGGSSGNYGLRDQIAALAWVHQNIAAFGGDPTHVTIFGASSGSSNIEALLTSPLTQGPSSQCGAGQQCFSAAIMEGGSVVHNQILSLADKETQDAPLVAGINGCVATDVSCLRGVPAATLVAPCIPPAATSCNPNAAYSTWYSQADPVLIVNLEPDVIPMNPYDWLQDPLHGGSPVPLLLGSNREDAAMSGTPSWCVGVALPAPQCPNDDPTSSVIDENGFNSAIHAEFDSLLTTAGSNNIVSLYPASNILDAPVWQLIAVDSDLTVGAACPYREVARAAVGTSGAPVWRYVYIHTFENNDPNLTPYRAFHGAEKHFVFGDPSFADPGNYTPTPAELALSAQIMGYWTRFAATGNPNGTQATVWPPYNAANDPMLEIDDVSVQINGYRTQQCDFYDANAAVFSTLQ